MGSRTIYNLHGFVIDSDLPLDADPVAPTQVGYRSRSVRLRCTEELAVPSGVSEVVLRSFEGNDIEPVELVRFGDGSHLFSFGDYRMHCSPDLSVVTVAPGADRDMDWLSVLVEGWMVAVLVFLSGRTVLHSSAVLIDDVLISIVGDSTQGKSTLAAGLCTLGGQLFTDDVLAVYPDESLSSDEGVMSFWADRGSNALRLRPGAAALGGLSGLGPSRPVGDRTVVRPDRRVPPRALLRAVVIPWVSKDYRIPQLTWLPPAVAAVELAEYPRVFTWKRREERAQEFSGLVALAAAVPVAQLHVPPGTDGFVAVLELIRQEITSRPVRP